MISLGAVICEILLNESQNDDYLEKAAEYYVTHFPDVNQVGINEMRKDGESEIKIQKAIKKHKNNIKLELKKELENKSRRDFYLKPFDPKEYKKRGFNNKQIKELEVFHNLMANAIK